MKGRNLYNKKPAEILQLMKTQNVGLKTDEWRVLNHVKGNSNVTLVMYIDEESLKNLDKTNMRACKRCVGAALSIRGKLEKTAGAGNVKFVNNAGAFFFDSITYLLNGIEMEHVKDPGITSLIRGYLCYTEEDSNHLPVGIMLPVGIIQQLIHMVLSS
ncbi:unnamed protein product [Ceutorhynchus assimilis]|uniref:Uncharacterized protein n=1 Tax=Ceutorhynchus assimilis TaxID=467358 RepID=A0A9N9MAJ8_9CUCU|nr:unnamed protein product [Ceutorhynchus assimilis]